jgi:putative glutamine amidotransferase
VKPLITVALAERLASDGPPIWGDHATYLTCVIAAGGVPIAIPPVPDLDQLARYYELADGIFLPGGEDIDPSRYGEERLVQCGPSHAGKEEVELTLIEWARRDKKPILGVCRGAQLLNVAYGGTLFQDLPSQRSDGLVHNKGEWCEIVHPMAIVEDSRLRDILAVSTIEVNSLHHQAVKTLGNGLRAVAFAPDGLIEAVEGTEDGHFVVGVQCHPETLYEDIEPRFRQLFATFIAEAFRWRKGKLG